MSDEVTTTTGESITEVTSTGTTFTQEQVSAIAAKEAKKAEKRATEHFVQDLGFSNPDELKNAVDAFKQYQDQQKSDAERLAELQQEKEQLSGRASRYEAVTNALLERELESIPEDKRSLVPDFDDPVKALDYIARNKPLLVGQPAPANVGSTNSPGAPGVQSPITYDEYKKLDPSTLIEFHTNHPEVANGFAERMRRGN